MDGNTIKGFGKVKGGNSVTTRRLKPLAIEVERLRSEEVVE